MIIFKNKNKQKNKLYLINENIIYKKFKKPKIPLKFYANRTQKFFKLSNNII